MASFRSLYGEGLDFYVFDNDKHMFSGRSGKGRSKREVAVNHRPDQNGHSRKIFTKIRNQERNLRAKRNTTSRKQQRVCAAPR